jgi:Zn-dependent alcohol dehydrogenase
MRAAVLTGLNQPLEIRDVKPLELQFGQVLVKVLVSGICGAQLQEIRGDKGNEAFLPHLLGHEGCGVVEKVGPGVSKVRVGDKVVMHWRVGAGIESDFPSYSLDGKVIRSGKVTTLSEKSIVSENRLTAVPADTPPHLAALLGCGLSTALGVVNNDAHVKIGESVAVLGAGGVATQSGLVVVNQSVVILSISALSNAIGHD